MKLSKKIILGLGILLVLINGVYLYSKYQATISVIFSEDKLKKHPLFQDLEQKTVEQIQTKVATSVPEGSFDLGVSEKSSQVFEKFFKEIQSRSLFRIKVWDGDYTVIWSNAAENIGKRFPDNHEMAEVYEGEVESEIKRSTAKKENVTERTYSEYSETYVPIKDSNGKVIGAIEVYQVIGDITEKIRSQFYNEAGMAVGASLVLFLVIIVLGRFVLK